MATKDNIIDSVLYSYTSASSILEEENKVLKETIGKMKDELDKGLALGEFSILRTQLAREVYSKLMTELDATPQVVALSWEQKLLQIFGKTPPQITEGATIDGEFTAVGE